MRQVSYDAKISPIEKIAETFRTISLNDTLATVESRKVEHVASELLDARFQTDETSIDDINAIAHRIRYVFLHEAPKAR